MKTACPEFERRNAKLQHGHLPQEELSHWQAHVSACRDCREQLLVHEKLQNALAAIAVPELPQNFSGLVLTRLAEARTTNAIARRRRAWLYLYWIAALAASINVVGGITLTMWNLQFNHLAILLTLVPLSFFALSYAERIFARLLRYFAPLLR